MQAGWYQDSNDPTLLRYWDGTHWTQHTKPVDAGVATRTEQESSSADGTKRLVISLAIFALALAAAGVWFATRSDDSTATSAETTQPTPTKDIITTLEARGDVCTAIGTWSSELNTRLRGIQAEQLRDDNAVPDDAPRLWMVECHPTAEQGLAATLVAEAQTTQNGNKIDVEVGEVILAFAPDVSAVADAVDGTGIEVLPLLTGNDDVRADICLQERKNLNVAFHLYLQDFGRFPSSLAETKETVTVVHLPFDPSLHWLYSGDPANLVGLGDCAGS